MKELGKIQTNCDARRNHTKTSKACGQKSIGWALRLLILTTQPTQPTQPNNLGFKQFNHQTDIPFPRVPFLRLYLTSAK
jgi:hypothetical protein